MQPPTEFGTSSAAPLPAGPLRYAGFWRRVLAWIIDYLICMVFYGLCCLGAWIVWEGLVDRATIVPLDFVRLFGSGVWAVDNMVWFFTCIASGVVCWLYYAFMESSPLRGTLGKLALQIAVTDMQGMQVSFARASGRFAAKFISGLTIGVGYVMAGFTERRQALHDTIAKCLVVQRRSVRWSDAAVAPKPVGLPVVPRGKSEWPASVLIFGILNIVFVAIGLLMIPCSIVPSISDLVEEADNLLHSPSPLWSLLCGVVAVGFAIWVLVLTVGLLNLKRWSRSGLVAYAWSAVLFAIIAAVVESTDVFTSISVTSWEEFYQMAGVIAWPVRRLVIRLTYPVVLLIFMKRPRVVAACAK